MKRWRLRYASHLGYRSPDSPLFLHSVGSLDPLAHIDYAAGIGFAGVQDVHASLRSPECQRDCGRALRQHGLESGCMLYAPMEFVVEPLFRTGGINHRFLGQVQRGLEVAARTGCRHLAVLAAACPKHSSSVQREIFTENLATAARLARDAGVALCLEAIPVSSLGPMLITHLGEAMEVLQRVDSAHVRLIFDTAHVQAMEGDPASAIESVYDLIDVVQIADSPGRNEPGTGCIRFEPLLAELAERGFNGLVELEHGWRTPGREAEAAGLARLRDLDDRIGVS